ncbi:MAG: YdeI/OmpD-associated family protein [Candidatus Atabeyarchaeum deiterrae]
MTNAEELHFIDRGQWRSWLVKNHDTKTEVWLIFYKKLAGATSISYDDAVEEALCFGWIDSIIKRIDENKFARKFTRRKPKSKWSKSNRERAERMIKEGRMTEYGLSQIREAKENGEWFIVNSRPIELEIPQFVKEELALNKKASWSFDSLAKSNKQQYIKWILSAKRDETRKRRLAEAVEHLEKGEKLGMK